MATQSETAGPKPDYSVDTPGHVLRKLADGIHLLRAELVTVRARLIDQTRPVDEYPTAGPTVSPVQLHPDFDTVDELITSIIVNTPAAATQSAQASQMYSGNTVTGPAAGTTVVTSGTLPAGTYSVSFSGLMSGTVTFADINNVQLRTGATVIGPLPMQGSAEFLNTSGPYTVIVPSAGATINVSTIGTGSGTAATYGVLEITPQNAGAASVTLQLGNRVFSLPSGLVVFPAPLAMILSKTDQRILSWSGGGVGSVELMGYAYGGGG